MFINFQERSRPPTGMAENILRHLLLVCAVTTFASSTARAVYVDLTQPNSSGSVNTLYGTAFFTTDTTQPTGTGVFDPFLTIQRKGVEEGYNSSDKNAPFDVKRIPVWNHEFTVAEMKANASVFIGNEVYYRFLIDINEPNAANATDDKPLISLDSLKMFTSPTAGQTTHNVESLGVKRFDLDLDPSAVLMDNYVLYDDRNHGSGQSDIAFFIPAAAFSAAANSDFVYMYQKFGEHVAADPTFATTTEGGFEETRFGAVPVIPEASTVVPLAGTVLMAVGVECIRRRRQSGALG
jgi:hypothetical protein